MANLKSTPTQIDFSMPSGDSRIIRANCVSPDRQPYSLSQAIAIVWQLAKTVNSLPLITKTLTGGVSIRQDGLKWIIDVSLLPVNTENLKGDHYHECQVTFLNGTVLTPFSGVITITQDLIQ